MNKKLIVTFFFLTLLVCSVYNYANAQASATQGCLKISGEVTKELQLCLPDLAKMERASATIKDKDGVNRTYKGVPVSAILDMAGVTIGKQLRGKNMAKYLLVSAADNYQVVFSLAELDSSFADRVVILADEVDDKPLPAGMGPLRIIVPGEKKAARNIFQVTSFVIRFAKE